MSRYSQVAQKIVGKLGLWVGAKGSEIQVADSSGHLYHGGTELTITASQLNDLQYLTASYTEINQYCDMSGRLYSITGAGPTALNATTDDGEVIVLNKADGQAITLPAATGSGARFQIIVGTTITSSATTIKVTGNDVMYGYAIVANDDSATGITEYKTAADTDTITMDGSTKGGIKGDIIELVDFAADCWFVSMRIKATGTEATPFSATVS